MTARAVCRAMLRRTNISPSRAINRLRTYVLPPVCDSAEEPRGYEPVLTSERIEVFLEHDDATHKRLAAAGVAELSQRMLAIAEIPNDIHLEVALGSEKTDIRRVFENHFIVNVGYGEMDQLESGSTVSLKRSAMEIDLVALALLLGHEIGHLRQIYSLRLLILSATAKFTKFGPLRRKLEFQADRFAVECAWELGFDYREIEGALMNKYLQPSSRVRVAKDMIPKSPIRAWLSAEHPPVAKRRKGGQRILYDYPQGRTPRHNKENIVGLANAWWHA